jgi:hypothetical protein
MRFKGIAAICLALAIGAAAYASEQNRRLNDADANELNGEHAVDVNEHVIYDEVDVTN